MVASKLNVPLFVSFLVLFSSSCNSGEVGVATNGEVRSYLESRLAESTAVFGKKIEQCEQMAEGNSIPAFDKNELQRLGATTEDVVVAVGHVNFSNSFNCSRSERMALAFDLGLWQSARTTLGLADGDLQAVQVGLVYPSVQEISYTARYATVPPKLKLYIERALGEEPFDLLQVLEANQLL